MQGIENHLTAKGDTYNQLEDFKLNLKVYQTRMSTMLYGHHIIEHQFMIGTNNTNQPNNETNIQKRYNCYKYRQKTNVYITLTYTLRKKMRNRKEINEKGCENMDTTEAQGTGQAHITTDLD